jgi:hypothetical protein
VLATPGVSDAAAFFFLAGSGDADASGGARWVMPRCFNTCSQGEKRLPSSENSARNLPPCPNCQLSRPCADLCAGCALAAAGRLLLLAAFCPTRWAGCGCEDGCSYRLAAAGLSCLQAWLQLQQLLAWLVRVWLIYEAWLLAARLWTAGVLGAASALPLALAVRRSAVL